MFLLIRLALLFVTFLGCSSKPETHMSQDWRRDSQKLSLEFARSIGPLDPEFVRKAGFSQFNSKVPPYSKNIEDKYLSVMSEWNKKMERLLSVERHPELRTDAKILQSATRKEIDEIILYRSLGVVPFIPVTREIRKSLSRGLYEGASRKEMNDAMARFRLFVRGNNEQPPLVEGAMALTSKRMDLLKEKRKKGFWPTRMDVADYLNSSVHHIKAIEELLKKWPGDEWKRDLSELKVQDEHYRKFIFKKVLPYSGGKVSHPEFYKFQLKRSGIFASPEELIEIGKSEYRKTYEDFKKLALSIAQKHSLPSDKPVSVLQYLRSHMSVSPENLLSAYKNSTVRTLNIVRDFKLMTVHKVPDFKIRFASVSESDENPFPRYLNQNARGEYLIPNREGKLSFSDFDFSGAILNITAHEIMPGHALHFMMVEKSNPTRIRKWFTNKVANTEVWGMYAEDMIFPHLLEEEKFIFLQRKLWRQARMFLEPQLNLGLIRPQDVRKILIDELGFSEKFFNYEILFYSDFYQGEAPAAFYGYNILKNSKRKLIESGAVFTEKCFNDTVLNFGLLPLEEVSLRLMSGLDCSKP